MRNSVVLVPGAYCSDNYLARDLDLFAFILASCVEDTSVAFPSFYMDSLVSKANSAHVPAWPMLVI